MSGEDPQSPETNSQSVDPKTLATPVVGKVPKIPDLNCVVRRILELNTSKSPEPNTGPSLHAQIVPPDHEIPKGY